MCSALLPPFGDVQPAHGKLALVSGLIDTTYALFTLGFPMAPPLQGLAGSIYQLVGSFFNRHAVTDRILYSKYLSTKCDPLPLIVSIRFQVYFTALTGLLVTFPSRYLFTIGL